MIKNYIQFNESSSEYIFNKVFLKVYSEEDKDKVFNYVKNLLNLNIVNRFGNVPYPNYLVIKTNGVFKGTMCYLTDYDVEECLQNMIKKYPNEYDPQILQMKDLKILGNILLNSRRMKVDYNQPRQLVYESMDNTNKVKFISSIIDDEIIKSNKFGLIISNEDVEFEKNVFSDIFSELWDDIENAYGNEYSDLRKKVSKYIMDNLHSLIKKYFELSFDKNVKNMYNCHVDSCISLLFLKINNKLYD